MRSIRRMLCIAALATGVNGALFGGIVTYTSRASFDGAAPGLAVEGFEAGNVAPLDFTACPSPLNGSSNNARQQSVIASL